MELRTLGSTGLAISPLAFGCAPVGSIASVRRSIKAMEKAFDLGVNLFDTADMYGLGTSEQVLGQTFRSRRDQIVISTKCGYVYSTKLKLASKLKPLLRPLVKRISGVRTAAIRTIKSETNHNFEPQYIRESVESSLRKLGTDYIDIFFLHDPPRTISERNDVFQMLGTLRDQGKIRFLGVSGECDVCLDLMRPENSNLGVSVLQVEMNLLKQQAMDRLLALAENSPIGLIARQPFGHGTVLPALRGSDQLAQFNLQDDPRKLAQLAIRFVLQSPQVASLVTSMISPKHIDCNLEALEIGPLSEAEQRFCRSWSDEAEPSNAS